MGLSGDVEKLVKDAANSLGNPTLPELVEKLVTDYGLKFKDATKAVYVLWKKGSLDMQEPKPLSTLIGYAVSLESVWFWAVTALVALTAVIIFGVVSSPLLYVRYVLGGIFILFLPGSMLMEALYPRGEDLDGLERVALSIGVSLAVVPLIGLVLNYTPWGITLSPIVISLAFFAEAMAFIALVRKYRYYALNLK
jgi:hypothetical protein